MLECLTRLGHDVETLAVFDNVPAIVEVADHLRARPGLQSLRIGFHHDRSHGQANVSALLDLMKVRYTGSGPHFLLLCKDKALA